MAEWKLFDGDTPYVSTAEFHEHRERAPHLEQGHHQARLYTAAQFVRDAVDADGGTVSVSDLGCGDGGLLSIVQDIPGVSRAWGYDFAPANQAGWEERGVDGRLADVFGVDRKRIELGRLTIMTEVLEHLANPHGILNWVALHSNFLVCSSPYDESAADHDECHAWAWDVDGYRDLVQENGWRILQHQPLDYKFQVILAVRENYELEG